MSGRRILHSYAIIKCVLIGIDASRAIAPRLTGTERYSRELIPALIRNAPQHRFRLYLRPVNATEQAEFLSALPKTAEVELVVIDQQRLWTHLGLGGELASRSPDALFVPSHVLPWRVPARVRTVATVHDVGYRHYPQAHPWRQRYYLDWGTRHTVRRADVVLADSHATAQDVARFYAIDPEKVCVAYPGALPLADVDAAQVQVTLAKHGLVGKRYIIHIGTLQPRKNVEQLLAAFRLAQQEHHLRDVVLVLAGGAGWGGRKFNFAPNERYLGYISDVEKAALLMGARALVFPSLYEGFGFPILEAHQAGIPVACSNTSSLPEVAGKAARYFDPTDIYASMHALVDVMTDEALRAALVRDGADNLHRFSWDACARIVLDMLGSPS
jgi:glycosyltransferase involved in cell wall biosynthesis